MSTEQSEDVKSDQTKHQHTPSANCQHLAREPWWASLHAGKRSQAISRDTRCDHLREAVDAVAQWRTKSHHRNELFYLAVAPSLVRNPRHCVCTQIEYTILAYVTEPI